MSRPPLPRRALPWLFFLGPLGAAFLWLALTSGPLAPVPVTLTTVQEQALSPTLFFAWGRWKPVIPIASAPPSPAE